jgi:hypothetical protein
MGEKKEILFYEREDIENFNIWERIHRKFYYMGDKIYIFSPYQHGWRACVR